MTARRLPSDSGVSRETSVHPSQPITILAFDYGDKNIGVAVGNTATSTANPLTLVQASSGAARLEQIDALVRTWNPERLVVGLPLSLEGGEQPLSVKARRFARQLAARFNIPVDLADERLSSVAAEEMLRESGRGGYKHKDLVHAQAACIVLQGYLDEHYASRH